MNAAIAFDAASAGTDTVMAAAGQLFAAVVVDAICTAVAVAAGAVAVADAAVAVGGTKIF